MHDFDRIRVLPDDRSATEISLENAISLVDKALYEANAAAAIAPV